MYRAVRPIRLPSIRQLAARYLTDGATSIFLRSTTPKSSSPLIFRASLELSMAKAAKVALSMASPVAKAAKVSTFRLSSLLRLETDPSVALRLFRNPSGEQSAVTSKPFRYSLRSYDLIVCKLGKARMFTEMEEILHQMSGESRFAPREALFCNVIMFYGRARRPDSALRTFDRIHLFRCPRTIRSFNSLLHALLQCGEFEKIRSLFRDEELVHLGLVPDACTYNVLIRAETLRGSMAGAWEMLDEMRRRGIAPTAITFGTLVAALCSNSKLEEAFQLKEEMLRSYNVKPSVCIYTSLIKGLCEKAELDRALNLKDEILSHGELRLDSAVYSTLIRSLFRMKRKGEVVGLLEEAKRIGVKLDTATYNAMIAGFCEDEKDFVAAFEALDEMTRNGCRPDVVSYNTIISGFVKAGRWREARELMEDMPRRQCRPDVVSYRTLFDGMCDAGEVGGAAAILEEMTFNGYKPAAASVSKFTERLLDAEGNEGLPAASLRSLMKVNAMGMNEWRKVVVAVVKNCERLRAGELFDNLSMSSPA